MALVGEFPGLGDHRRRLIRAPINPLDKSTIISILPIPLHEIKPTAFPSVFDIPRAPDGGFSLLTIGSSSWWKEMEDGQPFLEIPNSSIQMAESIIMDYCNGMFCCDMHDSMPGLFFIPGAWDKNNIISFVDPVTNQSFAAKLERAKQQQKNFYLEQVKQADILWARTNGNPLAISDWSRIAAEKLGLNRTWLADFKSVELSNCKACGELININYPVCRYCHAVIDIDKATQLGIKFAV
jgi:hypothetical protein